MMDTVLNIGLNDESRARAWPSRPATTGSPGTPTAACSRCSARPCSASTASSSRTPSTRPRRPRAPRTTSTSTPTTCRSWSSTFKGIVAEHAGRDVPAGPARADGPRDPGGLRLLERRPRQALPPPGAHPGRPRHRRQRLLDGVRQPRHGLRHRRRVHPRPGLGRPGRLRRLPAERAGRGRRRRHPQHRRRSPTSRASTRRPTTSCMAIMQHAGEALPRPVRHRVHHRARQALDAADPGRQAHRGRGLPDRHAARRRGPDRHGRGARSGSPARSSPS